MLTSDNRSKSISVLAHSFAPPYWANLIFYTLHILPEILEKLALGWNNNNCTRTYFIQLVRSSSFIHAILTNYALAHLFNLISELTSSEPQGVYVESKSQARSLWQQKLVNYDQNCISSNIWGQHRGSFPLDYQHSSYKMIRTTIYHNDIYSYYN